MHPHASRSIFAALKLLQLRNMNGCHATSMVGWPMCTGFENTPIRLHAPNNCASVILHRRSSRACQQLPLHSSSRQLHRPAIARHAAGAAPRGNNADSSWPHCTTHNVVPQVGAAAMLPADFKAAFSSQSQSSSACCQAAEPAAVSLTRSKHRQRLRQQQQQQPEDNVALEEQQQLQQQQQPQQHNHAPHQVQQQQQQQLPQPQQQQQQQQQAIRLLLLGIDPDTNGAIAVVAADGVAADGAPCDSNCITTTTSSSSSSSSKPRSGRARKQQQQHTEQQIYQQQQQQQQQDQRQDSLQQQQQQQQHWQVHLDQASVRVFDMPVQCVALKKATKNAPQRNRRRLDIEGAINVVKQVLEDEQQQQQQLWEQQRKSDCSSADSSSSSNARSSTAGCAGGSAWPARPRLVLRAFLEVSSILPTNGSLATLNQGYSVGAWSALLMSLGFEVCTIHVRTWKQQLGLLSRDKDSSRQLAAEIYSIAGNCQQQLIRRKRDHGRAEALLIAAWGLGWSRHPARLQPEQGPLRQPFQMDGGMHVLELRPSLPAEEHSTVINSSSSSNGNSSGDTSGGGCHGWSASSSGVRRQRVLDVAAAEAAAVVAAEEKRREKQLQRTAAAAGKKSRKRQNTGTAAATAAAGQGAAVHLVDTAAEMGEAAGV